MYFKLVWAYVPSNKQLTFHISSVQQICNAFLQQQKSKSIIRELNVFRRIFPYPLYIHFAVSITVAASIQASGHWAQWEDCDGDHCDKGSRYRRTIHLPESVKVHARGCGDGKYSF